MMNVAGMNPAAAGGPVGGMMMNNGSPAMQQSLNDNTDELKLQLNTYIYEYLARSGVGDVAKLLLGKGDKFQVRIDKGSPGNRKNGEVNGVDPDAMDMDVIGDFPEDLPRPQVPAVGGKNGFLFEWYSVFSDVYFAHLKRGKMQGGAGMGQAAQYLMHAQQMQRMRENQQNGGMMARQGMMNPQRITAMGNMQRQMVNGAMPGGDPRKTMTPQQMQQMKVMQQANQQQIPREQGDVEMNGRPGTPGDGENGGSPSKRPRLENQQFNGGVMPNGRPMQGMPPQGMMIQNAFNPQMNNPQFRQGAPMGQKQMQPNMANGMMNMNNAGSPMMPGMAGGQFGENIAMEMYNTGRMGNQPMQSGPGAANSGNHALQDYQMQLMLLEQQNKKRLMMARQEQDNAVNRDGAPMPVGMSAGMSPNGSRSGTSPNPTEQMKRTPQLGLPGSPAAGENMQGRSPTAMNFMNNMPPGDFNPAMFMGDKPGMVGGPGGPNMRPPTSMNMAQQGRVAGQFPGGQPMVQNPSQGGQPMGTPQQRGDMPPPQAPAGGSAQRGQPSSPSASGNAPPTPSQTNKANPKGKKAKEAAADTANNRKKPAKKGSQAANAADPEPPATPTPSTPITPQHPNSFNGGAGAKGQPNAPGQPAAPPPQMQQPQMQPPMGDFNEFDSGQNFNLDFSTLDSQDVLENFDFDSFLNTTTEGDFNFGGDMGVNDFGLGDGE